MTGEAKPGQPLCRHCGEPLAVPDAVADGGTSALEAYIEHCSDDCRTAEEQADLLDDYSFGQWVSRYCDRRMVAIEGSGVVVSPPDVGGEHQRSVARELFCHTEWMHHFPRWIRTRSDYIAEMYRKVYGDPGMVKPAPAQARFVRLGRLGSVLGAIFGSRR
jgi:DNA-directed RNA polymerase subunit N (RpoN/RPB10)